MTPQLDTHRLYNERFLLSYPSLLLLPLSKKSCSCLGGHIPCGCFKHVPQVSSQILFCLTQSFILEHPHLNTTIVTIASWWLRFAACARCIHLSQWHGRLHQQHSGGSLGIPLIASWHTAWQQHTHARKLSYVIAICWDDLYSLLVTTVCQSRDLFWLEHSMLRRIHPHINTWVTLCFQTPR